jgi:hypothetical protein
MSKDFEIIQWTLDEAKLQAFKPQLRNQLFGCMHAHNELTAFNRLLMFSTTAFGEGELHDSALSVQMWSILQVLAGKLVETWNMLDERFLRVNPTDPAIASLSADHKQSLQWLIDYFGTGKNKTDNPLRFLRDKTAFHYDKLNLDGAVEHLATLENTVYVAQQHPVNSLYYLGTAVVFRTIFTAVADKAQLAGGQAHGNRTKAGTDLVTEDAKHANLHMHTVLYGLISYLLEAALNVPLERLDQIRIQITDAPDPDKVALPAFIDIG